jgi:methionine synthase II (cobalamin-independent)
MESNVRKPGIVAAVAIVGVCAYQWYSNRQTAYREEIRSALADCDAKEVRKIEYPADRLIQLSEAALRLTLNDPTKNTDYFDRKIQTIEERHFQEEFRVNKAKWECHNAAWIKYGNRDVQWAKRPEG